MTGYRVSDGEAKGFSSERRRAYARLCLVRDIEIGVTGCLMVFFFCCICI